MNDQYKNYTVTVSDDRAHVRSSDGVLRGTCDHNGLFDAYLSAWLAPLHWSEEPVVRQDIVSAARVLLADVIAAEEAAEAARKEEYLATAPRWTADLIMDLLGRAEVTPLPATLKRRAGRDLVDAALVEAWPSEKHDMITRCHLVGDVLWVARGALGVVTHSDNGMGGGGGESPDGMRAASGPSQERPATYTAATIPTEAILSALVGQVIPPTCLEWMTSHA